MQAVDAAQITAQQQASWDRHANTYAEVVVGNDDIDAATPQVISAVKKHKELASGEQMLFKLHDGRVIPFACMLHVSHCLHPRQQGPKSWTLPAVLEDQPCHSPRNFHMHVSYPLTCPPSQSALSTHTLKLKALPT